MWVSVMCIMFGWMCSLWVMVFIRSVWFMMLYGRLMNRFELWRNRLECSLFLVMLKVKFVG